MKILHVSDLHLDTPFVGIGRNAPKLQKKLIQAPYEAFKRCINIAINERVDLVIISGDIYNSERQTINAQHFFVKQLERLNDENIAVVMLHGNHDYLRKSKPVMNYPENVKVFLSESVEYFDFSLEDGTSVRVYGFSYRNQWIKERKIKEFPTNDYATDFTIGMYHGSIEASSSDAGNYAPFTTNELLSKNYDYWALGHIHLPQVLFEVPLIQYAGTIQGRHRNEHGDRGCFIVELNKGQEIRNTFHSLADIVWEKAKIDCHVDWQVTELVAEINNVIENFKEEAISNRQSYIIELTLTNVQRLDTELQEQIQAGELMEVIANDFSEDWFVIINKILTETSLPLDVFEFDKSLKESFNHVISELEHGSLYQDTMQELFNHSIIKQRFSLENDTELKDNLINSAREQIAQLIDLNREIEGDSDED